MGKRELLLIAAFVIAGTVVYQLTAPPAAPGERAFSFSRAVDSMRRFVRGNRASAEATQTTTHPVTGGIREFRLGLLRGEITIVGEERDTIEAALHVRSDGFDDAEAQRLANASVLKITETGTTIRGFVDFPDEGRQTARIILRVPRGLQIWLEPSSGRVEISNVAAVHLGAARGGVQLRRIAGLIGGLQRGGDLTIADAGSIKLETNGSDAQVEQVRGAVSLNMRAGELRARDIVGPIDIQATSTDVALEKLDTTTGLLTINAVSGSVSIKGLRTEGRITARNADIEVAIDRAATLDISSEGGDAVEFTPPQGGYQLDAVTSDAPITLTAGMPEVETTGPERRARGPVNGGGPTISIRTTRGSITARAR